MERLQYALQTAIDKASIYVHYSLLLYTHIIAVLRNNIHEYKQNEVLIS